MRRHYGDQCADVSGRMRCDCAEITVRVMSGHGPAGNIALRFNWLNISQAFLFGTSVPEITRSRS